MKCAKAAHGNEMTEDFIFRWPQFKPWLLSCVTNWMVSVKVLPNILVLMESLNEKVYLKKCCCSVLVPMCKELTSSFS